MMPGLDLFHPDGQFGELHDRLAGVAAAVAADQSSPPDPEPEPPPKQPKAGRTPDGKFARGNPGGCGNPFARQVASFREALYEAVGRDMLKDLACRLWGMAMGGNVAAARLLLQYLVGKPQDPPHPDRVDRDEWQAYQSDAIPGQEFNQLMASMPVPMAVHMAQGVWPIVAEYMIRRPMAEMFKSDPAPEKAANGKPRKAKKGQQPPQDQPSPTGDIGAGAPEVPPAAPGQHAPVEAPGPAVARPTPVQQTPAAVPDPVHDAGRQQTAASAADRQDTQPRAGVQPTVYHQRTPDREAPTDRPPVGSTGAPSPNGGRGGAAEPDGRDTPGGARPERAGGASAPSTNDGDG